MDTETAGHHHVCKCYGRSTGGSQADGGERNQSLTEHPKPFLFASPSIQAQQESEHQVRQSRQGSFDRCTMGLVSFPKVIFPAVVASCVVSYTFWDLARNRKLIGGTVPHTLQDYEWERESIRKMDAGWPREAAGPVVMNPISRQNYRKVQ